MMTTLVHHRSFFTSLSPWTLKDKECSLDVHAHQQVWKAEMDDMAHFASGVFLFVFIIDELLNVGRYPWLGIVSQDAIENE